MQQQHKDNGGGSEQGPDCTNAGGCGWVGGGALDGMLDQLVTAGAATAPIVTTRPAATAATFVGGASFGGVPLVEDGAVPPTVKPARFGGDRGDGGLASLAITPVIHAAAQPSPPCTEPMCADQFVRVSSELTRREDATVLAISIEPVSTALRSLQLQLEPPPMIRLVVSAASPATALGPRVTLPMLTAGGTAVITAAVSCAAPLGGGDVALLGQLAYADAASSTSEPCVLSFKLPLPTRVLLRPHPIPTALFGQLWPSHAAEKKSVSPYTGTDDAGAFARLVQDELGCALIQTIGLECIACARLVGAPEHTLLLHGKLRQLHGSAIELTLRTKDPRYTDTVQRAVLEVLGIPAAGWM